MIPLFAKGLPKPIDDFLLALPMWAAIPAFLAGVCLYAWLRHRWDAWQFRRNAHRDEK